MIAQRHNVNAKTYMYPDPGHPVAAQQAAALLMIAMQAGVPVGFHYDQKYRIVEVHAIGTSTKDGSIVFRGYQIGGTASRPLPQWTLFSIDKVQSLTLIASDSEAPREGYAQGDKQMQVIIAEIAL